MKKRLLYISMVMLSSLVVASCKKKEVLTDNIVGLGGDTWVKGPLDEWIYQNYTKPYNIEVKYKWDRSELSDIYKTVVPIKEDLVIPVMDIIKQTWINPYVEVKGADFIKTYSQKQFYLAGSPSFNSDGTITLGQAEAGRKIIMLDLNTFDKSNKRAVRQILHTMHHEFGHILHQNIAFTPEYQRISAGSYTPTWFNLSNAEALSLGFITPYASSGKDDDFVEVLATLFEGGEANFDNVINNLFVLTSSGAVVRNALGVYEPNSEARNKLLRKKAIVIDYLREKWGINMAELQAKTQVAIEAAAQTPEFHTLVGPGKQITTININPQRAVKQSAKFMTAYNTANNNLKAAAPVRFIDNISLLFGTANRVTLRVNIVNPVANTTINADFNYDVSIVNGVATFKFATQPTTGANFVNARTVEAMIPTLTAYFTDQEFKIRWIDDIIPQSKGIFGGLVKTNDPTSFLYGIL
jgi:substrate import-associated zinc metallohydrolase lipoprotein